VEGEIQMKDLFKKDIAIKIVAVMIAILFWLYVYNTTNPYVPMTFTNIPLKVENENYLDDNGYIIKNKYKTSIDITIRGRQDAINKVRASDFEASLDFSQIKSVNDKSLKITGPICSQKDVKIESFSPESIDIQLARNKSNTFPVELVSNIILKPGYKILKTTLEPASIPIVTEEALIDSVSSIKAYLNAKDVDSDISMKLNCKVYNKEGKEIIALGKDLSVNVLIEVAKEVPITIVTKGKPATDYVQIAALVSPGMALLIGSADALSKVSDIKTEQVDIEGLKQNLAVAVALKLPDGIKLANTPKEVAVNISIEKLATKDITFASIDINMPGKVNDGSLNYEIRGNNVIVQLKGRLTDLNAVKIDTLNPNVDVSGLGEGIHKLVLNINLPSQVKLIQDAYVEVKISKTNIVQN